MPLYLFVLLPFIIALISYIFESWLTKTLLVVTQISMLAMAIFNFYLVRTGGAYYYMLGDYGLSLIHI